MWANVAGGTKGHMIADLRPLAGLVLPALTPGKTGRLASCVLLAVDRVPASFVCASLEIAFVKPAFASDDGTCGSSWKANEWEEEVEADGEGGTGVARVVGPHIALAGCDTLTALVNGN